MLSISGWFGGLLRSWGRLQSLGSWHFGTFRYRLPAIPERPLRIGFEHVHQSRSAPTMACPDWPSIRSGKPRNAHSITLQWVETGTSSDEAFRKGRVDLWPLMADLPDRRKRVHLPSHGCTAGTRCCFVPMRRPRRTLHRPHCAISHAAARSPSWRSSFQRPNWFSLPNRPLP